MRRSDLRREVDKRLGTRTLVWAGIRGEDVEPLADLPQLASSFSIISAYGARSVVDGMAYEDLTGRRVDLEVWDIDQQLGDEATHEFRNAMLRALATPSALLPYRPSRFLSAVWFARSDRCMNLGLFGAHQSAFEHKPWVETSVAALGVPHVPWTYIADEEQLTTRRLVTSGPLMLRRSRTSGGEGIVRVETDEQLVELWPRDDEAFVSVAPFIEGTPVNVAGTVWHDGVTVHRPSVQLIGIPSCVTRPFGYCGNDFGVAAQLPREAIDVIESSTLAVGGWLASFGYRGTFGVDYLVQDGTPLFTEVNARFQGSTHASSRLSIAADEPDLMLEHVAAMLGIDAPRQRSIADLLADSSDLAHFVVHWTGSEPARLDASTLVTRLDAVDQCHDAEVLARPDLVTEVGAAAARITVRSGITSSGFELAEPWESAVSAWTHEQLSCQTGTTARTENGVRNA